MGVYGDWLSFWISLKWSFKELQFLALPCWLHFSAPCCRLQRMRGVIIQLMLFYLKSVLYELINWNHPFPHLWNVYVWIHHPATLMLCGGLFNRKQNLSSWPTILCVVNKQSGSDRATQHKGMSERDGKCGILTCNCIVKMERWMTHSTFEGGQQRLSFMHMFSQKRWCANFG